MKTNKIKGFTLIECIIALFILGISSLLLVQAYSQLMRVTSMSNEENVSISRQMDDAENKADGNADKITATTTKKFTVSSVKVGSGSKTTLGSADYSFDLNSYQVKGKKSDGTYAADDSDANEMRYVYFK